MKIKINKEVKEIMNILEKEGFSVYLVGGAIRNQLLGIPVKDWDLATNAVPSEMSEVFDKFQIVTIPTGIEHGTMTVCYKGLNIEITTFRTDGEYSDNRRPDKVEFNVSLENDLARRDFTINAMAFNKSEGLIDPFNGYKDLKNGVIKCVGNAQDRFSEDALRMLRAIRFANVLNFHIDLDIKIAIKNLKNNMKNVSNERIQMEINKIFTTGHDIKYYDILLELTPWLFTEKAKDNFPLYNIFANKICNKDLVTNLTSIFIYDILNIDFLETLKYSNKTQKEVKSLLECCQEIEKNDTLFLQDYGVVNYNVKKCLFDRFDNLTIFKAMLICQNRLGMTLDKFENISNAIYNILSKQEPISFSDLDIDGNDLKNMDIEGKEIGEWLEVLKNYVWNNPKANKKKVLLDIVKRKK